MALRTAAARARREQPIKYCHTLRIMAAQTHLIDLDIDPDEDAEWSLQKMVQTILDESIDVETKSRILNRLVATEYQPKRPMRTPEIRNTKTTRGLEKLDLLHSMHYEHPEFTAQNVCDDYGRGKMWTAHPIFGHTFSGSERAVHWQIFLQGEVFSKQECALLDICENIIYMWHTRWSFVTRWKFGTNRTAHWKNRSQAPSGKE